MNGGGLNIGSLTSLPNLITGSGSSGTSLGDTLTFTNTAPVTLAGGIGGTGDIHFVVAGAGTTPDLVFTTNNNTSAAPGGARPVFRYAEPYGYV